MTELAELFRRDLTRLTQELQAFTDEESLWWIAPGVSNSAGNLTLHLEGNLREYIGRQLGHVPYNRQRSFEFSLRDIPAAELMQRIRAVKEMVPGIVSSLTPMELQSTYPEMVFGAPISTLQLLLSLYGHLNYHMGQIDYLRRVLTGGTKIEFASL
jgi:hypothetical protein